MMPYLLTAETPDTHTVKEAYFGSQMIEISIHRQLALRKGSMTEKTGSWHGSRSRE